jgi:phosphoenolpyruvate-protein kinase (PTS system EI component)
LSAAPRSLPAVKQVVRAIELEHVRELADRACRLPDAAAVRELVAREGTALPDAAA